MAAVWATGTAMQYVSYWAPNRCRSVGSSYQRTNAATATPKTAAYRHELAQQQRLTDNDPRHGQVHGIAHVPVEPADDQAGRAARRAPACPRPSATNRAKAVEEGSTAPAMSMAAPRIQPAGRRHGPNPGQAALATCQPVEPAHGGIAPATTPGATAKNTRLPAAAFALRTTPFCPPHGRRTRLGRWRTGRCGGSGR